MRGSGDDHTEKTEARYTTKAASTDNADGLLFVWALLLNALLISSNIIHYECEDVVHRQHIHILLYCEVIVISV